MNKILLNKHTIITLFQFNNFPYLLNYILFIEKLRPDFKFIIWLCTSCYLMSMPACWMIIVYVRTYVPSSSDCILYHGCFTPTQKYYMQKGQCQKKTQFINIIIMDAKIFKMLKVHLEFRYFAQISRLKKRKF